MDPKTAVFFVVIVVVTVLVVIWNRSTREWNLNEHPPVHVNILEAKIWNCSYPTQSVLHKLQSSGHMLQAELLHSRKDAWVKLLTAHNDAEALAELGLVHCRVVASMDELVARETKENWGSLQYHVSEEYRSMIMRDSPVKTTGKVGHGAVKRDTCTDARCADIKDQLVNTEDEWFAQYHNFSASYDWYTQLASDFPSVVTLNSSIGQSHYERDIIALHFTEQAGSRREGKPKIFLQCLLHSREWISGSVCMYIARYLANPHPSDHMLIDLLKRVEFIMVPIANPDGYFLTWLQYPKFRLWRKNVQPFDGTECAGVDLNRNFDTRWGAEGSSAEVCSELYHGPAASSEREVQAITGFLRDNSPVYGAIDFHSYHQKVLYPPAGTADNPVHIKTLEYISQWMSSAASQIGVQYSSHKMFDIYSATGTFADWFLEESKADPTATHCPIPITVELRPEMNDAEHIDAGFLLPTDQILPTCQEMLPAVVKFAQLTLPAAPKCSVV